MPSHLIKDRHRSERKKVKVMAMALLAVLLLTAPYKAAAETSRDRAHIAAMENGLVPAVVIAGRPRPTSTLASRMQATNTPGVSIAFIQGGHILWVRAYGLADVASRRQVTPETLFQAASISKPVSAAAALRLVELGKLSLDGDVNARLKSWHVPDTAFTADRKVTLRGILSHTAGLTVHGFPGYAPGLPLPGTVEILDGKPPANSPAVASDAKPGERWSYSGGGYVVAQLLMTEVTGQTYPDLMRDLVLRPTGMTHSTYMQPLPKALDVQAATGYFGDGKPLAGGHYTYPELAPAGLWTTPSDLAHFAIALQDAYAGSSSNGISPATAKLMLTPQMDDFGLGLNLGPKKWGAMFEHGGSNQGFQSEMRAFIGGSRQGVIIMTNGDGGQVVIGDIMRAIAHTYGWKGPLPDERKVVQLDAAALSGYAGLYEVPHLTTLTVTADNGRLYAVASALGPQRLELLAQTPTKFFVLENGITVEFVRDSQGVFSTAKIGGPYGLHDAIRRN